MDLKCNRLNRGKVGKLVIFGVIFLLVLVNIQVGVGAEQNDDIEANQNSEQITAAEDETKEKTFYFRSNGTGKQINGNTRYNLANTTKVGRGEGNWTAYGNTWSTDHFYQSFYLYPDLASNYTINGTMTSFIWMRADSGNNMNTDVEFRLYDVDDTGARTATVLTSDTLTVDPLTTHYSEYKLKGNISSNYTFQEGHSVEIEIYASGDSNNDRYFTWGNSTHPSRVILNSEDHIDIENVVTTDQNGNVTQRFDPEAADKNITFNSTVSDPFGGYDVRWVNFTLESPLGEVIFEKKAMPKTLGTFSSFLNNYSFTWDYSQYNQTQGWYNLTVYAVDNTGYNYRYPDNPGDETFGGHQISFNTSFFIGGELHYVNLKVEDSLNRTLPDSPVKVANPQGDIYDSFLTNSTGMVNISLSSGNYNFITIWQDVMVSNQTEFINENHSADDPLIINASVYDKSFKALDSQGKALVNATVYITHPNGTTTSDPYKTDTKGNLSFKRTAGGNYTLRILWRDVEVFFDSVTVDNNTLMELRCEVYHMTLTAVDSDGVGLENTQISIYDNQTDIIKDSQLTNESGMIESQLPIGTYDIEVIWQESTVGTRENITMNSDKEIEIDCEVFRLNLTILDVDQEPVSDSRVSIISGDSGKVISESISNETGRVTTRLPSGDHRVKVSWRNVEVYDDIVTFTGADEELTVDVFYLGINVTDARDELVEGAQISLKDKNTDISLSTGVTSKDGSIEARLPGTLLDITVTWQDAVVNSTDLDLTSSDNITIDAHIYYPKLKLLDSTEEEDPVENAQISVSLVKTGRTLESNTTNEAGEIWTRLPGSEVLIKANWRNVEVYHQTKMISSSDHEDTIELNANIYNLEVNVEDYQGYALEGAQIEFQNQDGNIYDSKFTNGTGSTTSLLPQTDIIMKVYWNNQLVKDYQHTITSNPETHEISITAEVYYLDVTVYDQGDNRLENATVQVSSDNIEETQKTNNTGETIFRLPNGTYSIESSWMNILVDSTTHDLPKDSTEIDIRADVYYFDVEILDSEDLPVKDASVTFNIVETGSTARVATTDSDGRLGQKRIPGTKIDINVSWKGVKVSDFDHTVTTNETLPVNADISYLNINVSDSRGVDVTNATVETTHEGIQDIVGSNITDSTGDTELKLPAGEITYDIYWQGIKVYNKTLTFNSDTGQQNIIANIYYMDLTLVDNKSVPVKNAELNAVISSNQISLGTYQSNSDGTVVIRAPVGSVDMTAKWRDVEVLDRKGYPVDDDLTENITLNIYYLDYTFVDSRDSTLESGQVSVVYSDTGDVAASGITEMDGEKQFRLAGESYDIEVIWKDVIVYSEDGLNLNQDIKRQETVDVHYLPIEVISNKGEGVNNAYIEVRNETGELVASGYTANGGELEFRLPGRSYTVNMRYRGDHLMSKVDITDEKNTELTASTEPIEFKTQEYPPAVYETNAFFFGLMIAIFLIALIYMIYKGKKEPVSEDLEEEEEFEEETIEDEETYFEEEVE